MDGFWEHCRVAIDYTYLTVLDAAIRAAQMSKPEGARLKTMCLAYPDLLVPQSELFALYGAAAFSDIQHSAEERFIRKWHGLPDEFGPIYNTDQFLAKLGLDIDYIDIKKIRGPEKVLDLNEPLPEEFHGVYDFVIDTGTLEHCFNVGGAFKAMCQMIKLGGRIITMAPMTIINHGFWNFSPGAYYEGFTKNGFAVHYLQGRTKDPSGVKMIDLLSNPVGRQIVPPEAVIMCIAKKIKEQAFAWPTQAKYGG
jgi:hypothetical protein